MSKRIPGARNKLYKIDLRNNAKDAFQKRARFGADTLVLSAKNVVNFMHGENLFYGRVNVFGVPVAIEDDLPLSSLRNGADSEKIYPTLGFVGSIFNYLCALMRRGIVTNKINPNDKYLSNVRAYRAFEPPQKAYQAYKKIFHERLGDLYRDIHPDDSFTSPAEFLNFLNTNLKDIVSKSPFTYPAFVKSNYCSTIHSGLAIEIADLPYNDDNAKMKHFYNNPNWQYFMSACSAAGFRIDKDIPWRIIVDIAAPEVMRMVQKQGGRAGAMIFSTMYKSCARTYFTTLYSDMFSLYNECRNKRYPHDQTCPRGVTKTISRPMPNYTLATFSQEIDMRTLARFYMNMRLNEERPNMSDYDRETLLSDLETMLSSSTLDNPSNSRGAIIDNLGRVINMLERILGPTIDKRGSLSYHRDAMRKMIDERSYIDPNNWTDDLITPSMEPSSGTGGGY